MKIIKQILFIIVLFICNVAFAQTKTIDKLIEKINTAKTSSQQLQYYLQLFEQHESVQKDSLWKYALRAKALAKKDDKIHQGLVNIAIINALFREESIDTALSIIRSELPKYSVSKQNERAIFFKLSKLKADYYNTISNYTEAIPILYSIVSKAEQYKDTLTLATCYNSLGEIAYNRDQTDEAIKYFNKTLNTASFTAPYFPQITVSYLNLAIVYQWINKLDSSAYYVQKAMPLAQQTENLYHLCYAYIEISNNYKYAKKYKEAEVAMLKAMDIRKMTEGEIAFSNEKLALGNLYVRAGEIDKAIKVFKDGLAYDDSLNLGNTVHQRKHKTNMDIYMVFLRGLARCYKAQNNHDLYQQTLEKMLAVKDSFYEINSAEAIADLQVKYETQKKENTIIQQQLDLSKKNNLLFGSIGLLAALAIIFGVLFWSYKSRQELKLQQQIEEDKWLTQQEVAKAEEKERSRIAADLHDNLGVYAASIASNLNHIKIDKQDEENVTALNELRNNSQAIVSQLGDTIWVLKKDIIILTSICDRVKLLINRIQKSFPDIEFNVSEYIDNDIEFSASHAYHLYRIIQEAINNALKHSQCNKINIDVKSTDSWNIIIADNGIGIRETNKKIKEGGNGLTNMQERGEEVGWTIEWQPNENGGTKVIIAPTTN